MVQDPTQFDVLVMPNLYGDILRSDIFVCNKYLSVLLYMGLNVGVLQ